MRWYTAKRSHGAATQTPPSIAKVEITRKSSNDKWIYSAKKLKIGARNNFQLADFDDN
jgi:hypothetical protein